jgi:hypothetical protein
MAIRKVAGSGFREINMPCAATDDGVRLYFEETGSGRPEADFELAAQRRNPPSTCCQLPLVFGAPLHSVN